MASSQGVGETETFIGIDFGTSHSGVAATGPDGEPTMVPMGRVSGGTGSYDRVPNAFQIKEDGQLELVPYHKLTDYRTTAFGLKQALDPDLLAEGGKEFRDFLATHGKTLEECLKLLFTHIRTHVNNFCEEKKYGPPHRVKIAVPVKWTLDEYGKRIQKVVIQGAVDGGFDPDNVNVSTEPEEASNFISYQQRKKREQEKGKAAILIKQKGKRRKKLRRVESKRVLVMDIGAGLAHFDIYEMNDIYMLLEHQNQCEGGMDQMWRSLQKKCRTLRGNSTSFFKDAKTHVEGMGEKPKDFDQDGKPILAKELIQMIDDCYKAPLEMAKNTIMCSDKIDKVVLIGTALIENHYIRSLWMRHINEIKEESNRHDFQIEVLDTANAVCMGASLPFSDDPWKPFWSQSIGFLVQRGTKEVIIQIKPAGTATFVQFGESVTTLDESPDVLNLHLHTFEGGGNQLPEWSRDSHSHAYCKDSAVPIGEIKIELKSLPEQESCIRKVMVKFTHQEGALITLKVSDLGIHLEAEIDLELSFDGKNLQVQRADPARILWKRTSGKEDGEVPSSQEPGNQHPGTADHTVENGAGQQNRRPEGAVSEILAQRPRRKLPTQEGGQNAVEVPDSEDERRKRHKISSTVQESPAFVSRRASWRTNQLISS